ncbi:unnamed protein product, partial [marine sediment metagenome]
MKNIVRESCLNITINGEEFISLSCIPRDPVELVLGFLYNEQWIDSLDDVIEITIDKNTDKENIIASVYIKKDIKREQKYRLISSTSAKVLTSLQQSRSSTDKPLGDFVHYSMTLIWGLFEGLNQKSELYRKIGGVHSALLYFPSTRVFLNYFDEGVTNGFVEGLNHAIRNIIHRAFGYHSFENFKLQVLVEHGVALPH